MGFAPLRELNAAVAAGNLSNLRNIFANSHLTKRHNLRRMSHYLSQLLNVTFHESAGCAVIVEERRQKVLELVNERGFIALSELAKTLSASESTIRRDLQYWDQHGLIKRTHGGAMFREDVQGLPALEDRTSREMEEKRQIARFAASRIQNGDSILIDGGTTTLELAKLLVGRPLQIVTNSLPIANLFASSRETDLVMLGGYVYPRTGVALGPLTMKMLDDIHVQQTIMSVGGITAAGLFNSNLLLVETERAMMRSAAEVVVVADHTKIGQKALAFLCELAAIDTLIVDVGVKPEQRTLIEAANVKLLVAGEPEEFRT
jgi:DeoR family transcriptional regulator, fructose operon transcriptional repressor